MFLVINQLYDCMDCYDGELDADCFELLGEYGSFDWAVAFAQQFDMNVHGQVCVWSKQGSFLGYVYRGKFFGEVLVDGGYYDNPFDYCEF